MPALAERNKNKPDYIQVYVEIHIVGQGRPMHVLYIYTTLKSYLLKCANSGTNSGPTHFCIKYCNISISVILISI